LSSAACAEELLARPEASSSYGRIGEALRGPGITVLRPDESKPEWWAGASSVVRGEDGTFWMACRMRSADLPRGLRGYEIRILKSADGERFETVHRIKNTEVPIAGFERPALLRDPDTGRFKLYACGPWQDGLWCILKFDDADSPEQFDASTARPVIAPRAKTFERDQPPVEYKDPVLVHAEGVYHAYVIGYARQNERIYHFSSTDGEAWVPVGNPYEPLLPLSGWHDFFARPASVVPVGAGYLFVYEGSKTIWHDPVYNIATGLAFTFDLHTLIDLTPDAPLAVSGTPSEHFATFRYSSWLTVGDETWIYAEVACPDETHEVRLYKVAR
jgi:hypothetical protein